MALGIVLLQGPGGALFLMSEVPLYQNPSLRDLDGKAPLQWATDTDILTRGADPSLRDLVGKSPLPWAILATDNDILTRGADPSASRLASRLPCGAVPSKLERRGCQVAGILQAAVFASNAPSRRVLAFRRELALPRLGDLRPPLPRFPKPSLLLRASHAERHGGDMSASRPPHQRSSRGEGGRRHRERCGTERNQRSSHRHLARNPCALMCTSTAPRDGYGTGRTWSH